MSDASVIDAIRARFKTEVADVLELLTVYDNGTEPTTPVAQWCRFSVQVDETQLVSMGVRRYRMRGAATAMVFGKSQKGEAGINEIADAIVAAFRGVSLASPMVTFSPAPGFAGLVDRDEGWARRTVRIPFRADVME